MVAPTDVAESPDPHPARMIPARRRQRENVVANAMRVRLLTLFSFRSLGARWARCPSNLLAEA